jgi:peptidoglycan/LPS O-acetylase OafA/YrhL
MAPMDDDEKKWMKERRTYMYLLAATSYLCGLLITYTLLGAGRPFDWTPILIGTPLGVAIAVLAVKAVQKFRRLRQSPVNQSDRSD